MEFNDKQVEVSLKEGLFYYSENEVKKMLHAHGVIEVNEEVFQKKGISLVAFVKCMMAEIDKIPTKEHINQVFTGICQYIPALMK